MHLSAAQGRNRIQLRVVGVVSGEQSGPQGFDYQRFREFMTQEVNAAVEAAFEAGATEVVVSDSHGNGQNLLIEKLPKNILLVRSWPRPLMMMQGIDETFAGAIFIGYHSGTTNPQGVRAHTISSARLADVSLNNISMPEAGINAAIAGHFNVGLDNQSILRFRIDQLPVKTVAIARNGGDIAGIVFSFAQGLANGRDVHAEVRFFNYLISPTPA
jgi:D-amino peptidase